MYPAVRRPTPDATRTFRSEAVEAALWLLSALACCLPSASDPTGLGLRLSASPIFRLSAPLGFRFSTGLSIRLSACLIFRLSAGPGIRLSAGLVFLPSACLIFRLSSRGFGAFR